MKRTIACLLPLILAGSLFAAEAKVVGFAKAPVTVPVGQIIQLPVTGLDLPSARKSQTTYYPRQGVLFLPAVTWDGTLTVIFSAQTAGNYLVGIYFPNADGSVGKTETEIVVGTPVPPVPPVPPIPPVPPPADLWGAIIVEESKDRTPELAALVTSSEVAAFFSTAKLAPLRVVDQDATDPDDKPVPDLAPYVALAKKDGLPRLFVVSKTGQFYFAGTPPATVAAFLALMKTYSKGAGVVCPDGKCPIH